MAEDAFQSQAAAADATLPDIGRRNLLKGGVSFATAMDLCQAIGASVGLAQAEETSAGAPFSPEIVKKLAEQLSRSAFPKPRVVIHGPLQATLLAG